MEKKRSIIDDCKMFLGKHPYNTSTNIVEGDAFFYKDMCKRYGEENVANAIRSIEKTTDGWL